jgi:MFS family permease
VADDNDGSGVGYRAALTVPLVRTLFGASGVSMLGDYIAQGALLVLAFERSGGQVLGSAAILAAAAIPALLSGALAGSWLDRLPRGRTLVTAQVIGALAVLLPLLAPGLAIVFVAAAILGAVRATTTAVRAAAMVEGLTDAHRGPLLAMMNATEQGSQVVGYLVGAGLAASIGAGPALLADAASFLVGAVVLSRATYSPPTVRERRPPVTAGIRDIWSNPLLRLLALLVWVTATVGALPEALASGVADQDDPWLPFVFAAAPAGQVLAMIVVGRVRHFGRPSTQLIHLAWLSLAFGVAAQGRSPAWFVLANFLVGSGVAWTLGPQLSFMRVAPESRMAQITGTMIAVLIAAEGLGTPFFAWMADRTSVTAVYRIAGFLVLIAALLGWLVKERMPLARALDADPTAVPQSTSAA